MKTIKTTAKVLLTVVWFLSCIACPVNVINTDMVLDGIWGK